MATLKGYCRGCGEPVEAFVNDEDLRRESESGFAAWLGVSDVTCSKCGTVLGEDGGAHITAMTATQTRATSCPNRKAHTKAPADRIAFFEWAERKRRTHKPTRCPACGLYVIWEKKIIHG